MNLLENADPRSRELIEAVLSFKSQSTDFNVDDSFYKNQGIQTFMFVDGDLRDIATLQGVTLTKTTKAKANNKNRTLAYGELHNTLENDTYLLDFNKHFNSTEPVRVLRIQTSGKIHAPHLVIRVANFIKATIIEETISLDKGNINVGETHLEIGESAFIEHIQSARAAADSKIQGSTFAHVSKDSTYKNFSFHLEGTLNQRTLDLHLLGAGSHGESHILYLLNAQEKSTVDTVIHHYTPDSTSAQLAKGILDGESRGSFTGRIHIHKDAQRVNSSQLNKNLLLSKKAQAFSEPQLEIFADDVKCSHGSTTGQLSPEELFYFEARGIPHERARNLLALGFGLEVVTKIENSKARAHYHDMIVENLKTKFNLGAAQ